MPLSKVYRQNFLTSFWNEDRVYIYRLVFGQCNRNAWLFAKGVVSLSYIPLLLGISEAWKNCQGAAKKEMPENGSNKERAFAQGLIQFSGAAIVDHLALPCQRLLSVHFNWQIYFSYW